MTLHIEAFATGSYMTRTAVHTMCGETLINKEEWEGKILLDNTQLLTEEMCHTCLTRTLYTERVHVEGHNAGRDDVLAMLQSEK